MKTLLHPKKCLTYKMLQAYYSSELPVEKRFEVENHLLDCPLCSDALEGYHRALQEGWSGIDQEMASLQAEVTKKQQGETVKSEND